MPTELKRLLVHVEECAHVGRGVGGAGRLAAPKEHDDADDEQAHERAAEAGGKPNDQRRCVVTYHRPTTGVERHSVWATLCVSAWVCGRGCNETFGPTTRRRVRALVPTCTHSHLGLYPLRPVPTYTRRLLSVRPLGGACGLWFPLAPIPT